MGSLDERIGKDIKMTFKNMKFHVKNPAESEAVQKKLYALGYKWLLGNNTYKHTTHPVLYTYSDGEILYQESLEGFEQYEHEEVNVQEFIKGENNTMTTLEQQIKDTQEQLEKLTKALEEQKNKLKEWPQVNDEYYIVRPTGIIDSLFYTQESYDENCKAMHNCFKTKDKAEHYRDWLKSPVTHSRYLLQKVADEYNGDWKYKPNVNHGYFIYISNDKMRITFDCAFIQAKIYFKDIEGCQKAIEVLGEETIKLACGVV